MTTEDEARRVREEVERIEARRLHLSESVMKGDEKALEEDRRLELRIRELARRRMGGNQDEGRGRDEA
jgi:predicted  nucleic acid-binding Zn-ribbon protein